MDLLNNKLLVIHSEVKSFSEYWLRTIRVKMLDALIYCNAEFYKDSRTHSTWIHKSYSAIIINSWQQQYPDRMAMDLTNLQPLVITWRTHINYARCPGKKISKEGRGKTVEYVVHKLPIMALIIFPKWEN